ncbi:MAG: hypothetical protein KDC18_07230 [Alphaproteobacteria bacterium]|nr:hypothetical protein [Alphaproteobacteria bacterium]
MTAAVKEGDCFERLDPRRSHVRGVVEHVGRLRCRLRWSDGTVSTVLTRRLHDGSSRGFVRVPPDPGLIAVAGRFDPRRTFQIRQRGGLWLCNGCGRGTWALIVPWRAVVFRRDLFKDKGAVACGLRCQQRVEKIAARRAMAGVVHDLRLRGIRSVSLEMDACTLVEFGLALRDRRGRWRWTQLGQLVHSRLGGT